MHQRNTNLSVELMVVPRHPEFPEAQRVYALHDTDIILPGIRARLGQGSRLIHPSTFNGSDVHVILNGNAHIEVMTGYRLIGACNGIVVIAGVASFAVSKYQEVIDITAFAGEVSVQTSNEQRTLQAFRCATYNTLTQRFTIKPVEHRKR